LLLHYGADPKRDRSQGYAGFAIGRGKAEVLRMLLEHGAAVSSGGGSFGVDGSTWLNFLLQRGDDDVTRETKLTISCILVEHAKTDSATAAYMRMSLEYAINIIPFQSADSCEILLEAGIPPRWIWDCAIQSGNETICRLLVQHGADPFFEGGDEDDPDADPFSEQGDEDDDDDDDDDQCSAAASPFQAAARQSDTRTFEYFLTLWDVRFASTGGKNADGDYPLHVVCSDPHVSLETIRVLVTCHAEVLRMENKGFYHFTLPPIGVRIWMSFFTYYTIVPARCVMILVVVAAAETVLLLTLLLSHNVHRHPQPPPQAWKNLWTAITTTMVQSRRKPREPCHNKECIYRSTLGERERTAILTQRIKLPTCTSIVKDC
jgi:hypothetical protein